MGARRDEIADLGGDFDRTAQQIQHHRRPAPPASRRLPRSRARRWPALQAAIGLCLGRDPLSWRRPSTVTEREAVRLWTVGRPASHHRPAGCRHPRQPQRAGRVVRPCRRHRRRRPLRGSHPRPRSDLHRRGRGKGDAGRAVQRAFENVIRNAVKYTAEGTGGGARQRRGRALCAHRRRPRPGVPEVDLTAI